MATYLWNVYVEIIQFSYFSDRFILSYKETARFTGTTLVCAAIQRNIRYILLNQTKLRLQIAGQMNQAFPPLEAVDIFIRS